MANIATLSVSLTANTKKLIGGFAKATKSVRKFANKTLPGVIKKVAKFGLVAGGAALGGILALVKATAESLRPIDSMSRRLGISTEALTEFSHVATLTNVDFKGFSISLQRMTRRVSEAAIGTGEAQGAIRELGLDAKALNKLPVDEQFLEITRAMEKVGTQTDRVRIAFKLFDSEGVANLQIMRLGAAGIQAYRAEARALGLTVGEDGIKAVNQFNDAWDRVAKLFKGFVTQFTIALAPALTLLFNILSAIFLTIAKEKGGITALAISFATDLVNSIKAVVVWGAELINTFRQIKAFLQADVLDIITGQPLEVELIDTRALASKFDRFTSAIGTASDKSIGSGDVSFLGSTFNKEQAIKSKDLSKLVGLQEALLRIAQKEGVIAQ